MKFYAAAMALLFSYSTALAQDARRYECHPVEVLNSSADENFIAANLEKRFLLLVDDETIYVSSISSRYDDSQQSFRVFHSTGRESTLYGINAGSVMVDTIAVSERIFRGAFHASISRQSPLGVNVWELRCQKQ